MMVYPWVIPAVAGALVGLGIWVLVVGVARRPAPDVHRAIARMSGTDGAVVIAEGAESERVRRLGVWATRRLSPKAFVRIMPAPADLELVGKDPGDVLGEKLLAGVLGLAVGPILTLMKVGLDVPVPTSLSVAGALVIGAAAFFAPNFDVRAKARALRTDFGRAVTAYLELIAVERISGSGATQAIEGAARVADNWPFARIQEALDEARWSGVASWTALEALAAEIDAQELRDVADIMRMAGAEDASVYDQLRARARALRSAQLAGEQQRAAEDSNRMTFPVTATAFVFLAMLLFPMLSMAFGT